MWFRDRKSEWLSLLASLARSLSYSMKNTTVEVQTAGTFSTYRYVRRGLDGGDDRMTSMMMLQPLLVVTCSLMGNHMESGI